MENGVGTIDIFMMDEIYFTTYLTETEHDIVHLLLKEQCDKRNLELIYYRKFKEGHVPMYRECKIKGNLGEISKAIFEIELETGNVNKKIDYKNKKIRMWEEPESPKCTGRCEVFEYCEGEIKGVDVYNKDMTRKWSSDYYCQRAIKDTEEMGYIVEIIK